MVRKVTPTLRLFIADLTRALAQNNGKVNIRRFIKVWRNEKGVKQVWDSPAPQKSREKKKQSA